MPLILCIDSALETASIGLAREGVLITVKTNASQMDHASWIHLAIKEALKDAGLILKDISAVAVTSGPGSYTGLRVGMATAKGICFALGVPLITENILALTAINLKKSVDLNQFTLPVLICPMIDARRMEVFTNLYDEHLLPITEPSALVLDPQSFSEELSRNQILFCGNGSGKWQSICSSPNATFYDRSHQPEDLALVAENKFNKSEFAELAYAEPDYFKNVYTGK